MIYQEVLFQNLDKILNVWMIIDSDYKIVHWSQPAKQQFGFNEDEINNQSFSVLLPEFVTEELFFENLLDSNQSVTSLINQSAKLKQKNNIIIDVEFSIFKLTHEDKILLLLSLDNITEEVELQQLVNSKMKQLNERFHQMNDDQLDQTIYDIFGAVLVSITAGQGLQFNRAFLLYIDQKSESLKGIQAIGPGSGEEAGKIYQEFDQTPKTLTEMITHYQNLKYQKDFLVNEMVQQINVKLDDYEHILIQPLVTQKYIIVNDNSLNVNDPSVIWLRQLLSVSECIIIPMIWHGRSIGVIIADNQVTRRPITNLDIKKLTRFTKTAVNVIESVRLLIKLEESITNVKKANLQIRESQAILVQKEKLAAMGELVAHMAHEVRGPLAIIGGFARRVFNQTATRSKHYDSLKRIVETVDTLELVINDILSSSVPEKVDQGRCDSSKVINRVIALMEEEILKREISVNVNLQGNLPNINIKEHHLFEIISNLVKNSVEAIDKNGLLIILANYVKEKIIFTIQDTGPGFPSTEIEKIFSPFYTTKKDGTGLGLVVVKKLVEKNGGSIEVTSVPTKGTTFKITFSEHYSE
ncbi:MAG: ATP-binding protein [Deltaproteobacteria bacterium]|nr:ATP-binding protein [Deltaproteobacteria bacterium]